MDFLSVRELTTSPKKAWKKLRRERELTVTNNGKPAAILVDVKEGEFEETLQAIKQARAMRLLNSIWAEAAEKGPLDGAEIEREIKETRRQKRGR